MAKLSKPNVKSAYEYSLKNLVYYLPGYMNSIIFNKDKYSSEVETEEDEEYEIEYFGLIV
jgi:hypothetical protein